MLRTSERAFEGAVRFNVTSAFLMTRFSVPHMVETAGGGVIINISSQGGSMVQPGFTSYGTSKAALSFMTRELAPELAPKVRVNAIELGGVETDALASVLTDESVRRRCRGQHPDAAVGQVEDIAAAVSTWVTGVVVGHRQGVRGRRRRRAPASARSRSIRCRRRTTVGGYVLLPIDLGRDVEGNLGNASPWALATEVAGSVSSARPLAREAVRVISKDPSSPTIVEVMTE